MKLHDIIEGPYTEKNGVLYTISVPKNVVPSRDSDPTNASSWSYWRKENFSFFKKELEALPRTHIILDVGAGQSDFAALLLRFESRVAVDFYAYPGIDVVCDLNKTLPFKDESVNAVMLSNVLEHIAEPNALLAECRRVLKPGGTIIGTVPFMISIHQRPYDFYRYTDHNLAYLLEKQGFGGIVVTPVLMISVLTLNILARFFIQIIERSSFSRLSVLDAFLKFPMKILWFFTRLSFKLLSPLLRKIKQDPNLPLGYLFKGHAVPHI